MNASRLYQPTYSNSWALVIGINDYKYSSPLGYAKNDATAVAGLLTSRFGFPAENLRVLLDGDATGEAIRQAFLAYSDEQAIGPDDRLLVFFAGHGHTVKGSRGEVGFLVPHDGKPSALHSLIRWDDLTRNADLIPAKHLFFLMDACYGGLALQRSQAFGNMRFLGDMLQRHARQVLTAGKADETVADGDGVRPGHSIFTAHLLDALEGAAATEKGIITASGVMAYVYDRVGRDQYSHQTPHYGFIDGDGDFLFDPSILESILKGSGSRSDENSEAKGGDDILINTSQQLVETDRDGDPVVGAMKDLLSDPNKRIRLDDFVFLHVRKFLQATDLRNFPAQEVPFSKEEFVRRIALYEEAATDLQRVLILLARWGNLEQLSLLERTLTRIAEADKGSSGLVIWLRLSWYPILFLIYSAGIAAVAAGNFVALRRLLMTPIHVAGSNYLETELPIIRLVVDYAAETNETFKQLPGHEKYFVPRSEHLFKTLQPELEDLLFLGKSYERYFDDFEVLLALAYADETNNDWGPLGRFSWKRRQPTSDNPFRRVMEEGKKEGAAWGPIGAGMFQGSEQRFLQVAEQFGEGLKRLTWF